jgi:hypothetical protein
VSHEIGTHLLHDLVVAAYEERCWRPDCLYKAYETLVMFLNSQVLALQELAYDLPSAYDHRGLLALYADLSDKQLPLAGLLRRGAEYLEARAASIPDGEESRITGALGSRVN